MRSSDFLLQLKKALENELSAAQVQDNVEYYKNYIKEEMKSGKSEQEVMDMLGDPWAIAKTILLEEKMSGPQESINSEEVWSDQEQKQQSQKIHVFGLDTWWKKAAVILGVIATNSSVNSGTFTFFSSVFAALKSFSAVLAISLSRISNLSLK